MSLLQRAKAARTKLEAIQSTRVDDDEIRRINELREEIERPTLLFMAAAEQTNMLARLNVSVPPLPHANIEMTLKKVQAFSEKFQKDTTSANLRRGLQLRNTIDAITDLKKELEKVQSLRWQNFLTGLFAGDSPDQLTDQLALTPQNRESISAYKSAYLEREKLGRNSTVTAEGIAHAKELSAELQKAYESFDFDVPSEVKAFFDASASSNGAPLTVLTKQVVDWLHENDMVDRYVVRNRG